MTRAHNRGESGGLVGDIFRLVVATALIAAVVVVLIDGLNSAGSKVDQRRLNDRVELAKALAPPLAEWLSGAQKAAAEVASGKPAVQVVGWDALRVDRTGAFIGLTGRYQSLSGLAQSHPCPTGAGLRELVDAAARSSTPVVMIVDPPGSCDPLVGAAASFPGGAAVVTGDVNSFLAQAAVASHFESGIRTYVVDPAGTTLSPGEVSGALPTHLGPFVAQVSAGQPATARNTKVEGRREAVVDAGAAVGGGWAVVVEQDAAAFDVVFVNPIPKSVLVIAGVLFLLIVLLQARRDAQHRLVVRKAEAHNAAFFAVLGHELRTPLTVIKGFVDTLSDRWDHMGDEQRHDLVDRLPMQTRRLNRVVDRLLLAANLQAGAAAAPNIDPVDVGPTLQRVAADYTPVAPLHEFNVEVGPDARVWADPKALHQIVEQLVDNAVKYSPSGGVVRLSAERKRGQIEIAVEDDGIGLPPNAGDIFDAFAQGEAVDSRVHAEGGVGLGLFIVRTLCEQLGGSVRAERRSASGSDAQRGSRFVVTLRACRARVPQAV